MCINESTKLYKVRAHPAHGETCARHLPISSLARPHFPLPENGLNKNYINYSGAPARPINLFQARLLLQVQEGLRRGGGQERRGRRRRAAAEPPAAAVGGDHRGRGRRRRSRGRRCRRQQQELRRCDYNVTVTSSSQSFYKTNSSLHCRFGVRVAGERFGDYEHLLRHACPP